MKDELNHHWISTEDFDHLNRHKTYLILKCEICHLYKQILKDSSIERIFSIKYDEWGTDFYKKITCNEVVIKNLLE